MKSYVIPILLLFTSCGTYHYISPTVNANMYSKQGEVVGGFQLGSAGIAANGGVAISKNFNINGFVAWMPEEDNGYNSRELELSAGYQTNPGKLNNVGSFFAGLSFGSNEYDKKELSGKFTRPFFQAQYGVFDRRLFNSNAFFDIAIGSRFNWILYDGDFQNAPLKDDVFYFEPYYSISLGGKNVHFHTVIGLPVKTNKLDESVRVLPIMWNIGMQVKFRRH